MSAVLAAALGLVLVATTILIHYEALRLTSSILPMLAIPVRMRILVVLAAALGAHLIEICLYALAYHVLLDYLAIGTLDGNFDGEVVDYLYFSASSYSSLGLGDIYPHGPIRLIVGMEALNGLLLIAWTASFTYLSMERFWDLHKRRK